MLIIHVSCKKYYKILSPNKHCKFTLLVLMSLGENIAVENTCKNVLPIEHIHSPLLPLCTYYRIYSIHNDNNEVVVLMYLTY